MPSNHNSLEASPSLVDITPYLTSPSLPDQGTTFAGTWNGKRVAIKRLAELPTPASSVSASAVSDLEHEATILSLLGHHPNIVDFYGLSTGGGGINAGSGSVDVVTKLEEGGSLAEVLGLNKSSGPKGRSRGWLSLSRKGSTSLPSLSEYDGVARATWARDIACGLANAHAAGVVHNDVACRNALLSRRGPGGSALLCDFGMSTLLRGEGVEAATLIDVGNGGSGRWPVRQMPPEALRPPHALSPVSDTYMFGTMLFEVSEAGGRWVGGVWWLHGTCVEASKHYTHTHFRLYCRFSRDTHPAFREQRK